MQNKLLFKFLKYIQPTSYFNLKITNGNYVFPNPLNLPEEVLCQLKRDESFSSTKAIEYDLAWQAVQYGYVGNANKIQAITEVSLADEYRFIRKYFQPIWGVYCLFLRVLSFNNPIKELRAWSKSKKFTKRTEVFGLNQIENFNSFESELIVSKTLVSVIIPTLNRYDYLADVLKDFEKQTYPYFELIIVDQSDDFKETFYANFNLNINLIRQEEKALWLARNTAIKNSKGSIIALSEDDVRIKDDWIEQHLKCLDYFKATISAGVFYPEGSSIPKNRSYFAVAQQFATGNAMLYKDIFSKVGLFDRQFEKQRMGDGEFGLRCFKAGFKSISNPFASCVDVKAPTGGLRELGSWDAFRPTNWFAPRPVPSVLYYYQTYFGKSATRYALLKSIPSSIIPYQYKRNKKMKLIGMFISVFISPLILFQIFKSWRLAAVKLKEGNLIDNL